MHVNRVAPSLSPEPILGAAEAFRGRIVDLDRSLVVEPAAFARGRTALAAQMRRQGLSAGDRVVMAIGNGPLFPAVLVAILEGGGSPLLVHAETPPSELRRTALQYGARFIACDGQPELGLQAVSATATTIAWGDWACLVWARMEESDPLFQGDYPSLPPMPLHPTSGTTGQPKIAARPGPCAIAEAAHYVDMIGIDDRDVILNVAPMCHAYAYGLCVMVSLLVNSSLVTMRRFSAKLVHRAIAEHGITILPAVPVMLDMLLFGAGDRFYDPSRRVFTAGAPLPVRTAVDFRKTCGSMVRPLFGSTETGVIAIVEADHEGEASDCVGPPVRGVSVEVRPYQGANLNAGVGRVHVRSSSMMAGYLYPGKLDPSPVVDGWFATGDLGMFDQQGKLHLKGRETDVVNVFGMKVVPSEVEDVIRMLPDIAEVMVYAGRRFGSQFVKAAVVVASPIDGAAIRAHCEKHLVYYKRPEAITFLEALPRTPTGKIIRDQLP
jgi:acyl-coenzyme A synthetase/AMP-(fatty) acid ligase